MTEKNRQYLNKAVNILKCFGIEPNNIMLVGSLALDLQGVLPASRIAHDADFVIKVDNMTWEKLKLAERDFTKGFFMRYDCADNVLFPVDDVTLNIWRDEKTTFSGLKDSETGVWVKNVGDILKKKKEYARSKDYKDINEICKNLI